MNKQEYHEWFDKYLGDVETDLKSHLQSPLLNSPKIFRTWLWIMILAICTIATLLASFCVDYYTDLSWLSNLLLSIGSGLIASIIILCFTTSKEKNVAYMTEIVPILKKRLKDMHDAYCYDTARQSIASQNGKFETYYDCAHRWTNTYTVILEFYKLLCEISKFKPKYLKNCFSDLEDGHEMNRQYFDKVCKNYNSKNKDDNLRELANEQLKIGWLADVILNIVRQYTEDMEAQLYKIKYNKKNRTKEMIESDKKMKQFRENINKINKQQKTKRK